MEVPQQPLPGLIPAEPKQTTLPGIPCATPSNRQFTHNGKEVRMDDAHYGDMVDENAAKCVADAMNAADEQAGWAKLIVHVK